MNFMNCDCIKTTQEQITPMIAAKGSGNRKAGALESVRCANVGLNFRTGKTMLGIPFTVRWEGQKKTDEVPVYAEFCPFCGKATRSEEGPEVPKSRPAVDPRDRPPGDQVFRHNG